MYSISRPNKYGDPQYDLSTEVQLHSQGCLSEKQASVSTRLLSNYGAPLGAIGTETRQSIRKRLMSKLWRMGKMLSKVGGPKRNKIISEWNKTE